MSVTDGETNKVQFCVYFRIFQTGIYRFSTRDISGKSYIIRKWQKRVLRGPLLRGQLRGSPWMVGSSFNGTGSSRYGRLVFFPAGDGAVPAVLHLLPLHMAHGSQGTHSRRKRKLTVAIAVDSLELHWRT